MAPNETNVLQYENEDVGLIAVLEKKGYRTTPILHINGARVPDKLARKARPNQTLLSYLRDVMQLTGSKLGCGEGGCGACTVMVSKKVNRTAADSLKHYAVNACLMPVLSADGCHITTVEGVGSVKGNKLHPIQKAMVDMHGSQCGYCTPGIIVSIYALLANDSNSGHLQEHLDGNLCRCTGYRPIWDAARSLCDDGEQVVRGPCGTPCRDCDERDVCEQDCNIQEQKEAAIASDAHSCTSSSFDKMKTYKDTYLTNRSDWADQPLRMFPALLLDENSVESSELRKPLVVVDHSEYQAASTWFKPTSFEQLLSLLRDYGGLSPGGCKIVVGNTEVGIETRFKHANYPRLISPSETIEELFMFEVSDDCFSIGSCYPLSSIQHDCKTLAEQDTTLNRTVMPIYDMLRWFASTQIRNVACLGGNLATASPISDMNPMLACMRSKLILASLDEKHQITHREVEVSSFFLRYRIVDLKPTEIIQRIDIPKLRAVFEYVKPFKQARRREDDISIVSSGMRIRLKVDNGKYVIEDAALAFGGMAIKTVLAVETATVLIGSDFSAQTFQMATEVLLKELSLPLAVPGGQAAYRMALTASFLHKFFLMCVDELTIDIESIKTNPMKFPDIPSDLPEPPVIHYSEKSGGLSFVGSEKPIFSGEQKYPAPRVVPGLEEKLLPSVVSPRFAQAAAVGKPSTHQSGPLHCTGEALYTDDIPVPMGTLQAALVLSNQCRVVFESIDTSPALLVPGVVGVYTHADLVAIGGKNELGPIIKDETVFLPLGEKIRTIGQVLGIVAAETIEAAELAARMVKIQYGELTEKVIVTIEDAIDANSFYEISRHSIERGDKTFLDTISSAPDFTEEPKVGDIVKISGQFRSGAQEHFYLEPNTSLVVPSDGDTNLSVYCSTQATTKTHVCCASATGTPASKVVVRMKRMGGGFGGKETRSVFASCAAAVAAKVSCRPVRLTLGRDVDMKLTGTRHAFVSSYVAAAQITETGPKLLSCEIKLYSNGGCGFDLSGPVLDRALFHCDGCYNYPSFRASGVVCKTSQAPHTAFRGFGGPQGMAVAEHIMDHLAVACNVSGDLLRRNNMYEVGNTLPFGIVLGEHSSGKWNVPTLWDKMYEEQHIEHRRAHIEEFNAKHRWIKRGLSCIPTKFGIAFTAKYMNQGGALVHLYTDGTVLVSHGGTEMGQGLHTKVCQVAAQAFQIPVEDVYVNDSSTDKVANTIPTAASFSTDMYGMATLDACRQILKRLEPIMEQLGPKTSLKEIATTAHMARIDLSAHGFFALDAVRCGFDWDKQKPDDYPEDGPENAWKGHPFNYFTQGVACAEVEVDLLSGNHRTLRSDILVDVGSSINPAIDIGQIEGAFVQGMGWSTIEECTYADDEHSWVCPRGALLTTGPGTYKIPAFNDMPEIFNVSLMPGLDNPFAVHSSKAIGEPPFFLGTSVFYAIKDALIAARKQNLGKMSYFEMRMPATSERIRMYAADELVEKVTKQMLGDDGKIDCFQPCGSY